MHGILLLILIGIPLPNQPSTTTQDKYQLVWADEFDEPGRPNPKNWTFEHGFVRNKELQWYQPENAWVEDGKLIIEGRKIKKRKNPKFKKGSKDWKSKWRWVKYTSASVTTRGRHNWKYGRFEVKAKITAELGLWPAIWFIGLDGDWPDRGEIDLMEFNRGNIMANACWGSDKKDKPTWDFKKTPLSSFKDPKWDDKFHLWVMEWDHDLIKLSVDGRVLNTIDVRKALNRGNRAPKFPFRQPHYLLINLALGGNSGGSVAKTNFPSRYEIDYVRVYQKVEK